MKQMIPQIIMVIDSNNMEKQELKTAWKMKEKYFKILTAAVKAVFTTSKSDENLKTNFKCCIHSRMSTILITFT